MALSRLNSTSNRTSKRSLILFQLITKKLVSLSLPRPTEPPGPAFSLRLSAPTRPR